jgi:hypothetical protein
MCRATGSHSHWKNNNRHLIYFTNSTTIMKKICCIAFICILQLPLFAQQRQLPDSIFLAKSKSQKTAAYITLGVGAATLLPGMVMLMNEKPGWNHVNWERVLGGTALIGIGVSCVTASIVLFAASKRNERNAYERGLTFHLNRPVELVGLPEKYLPYSVGVSLALK